MLICHQCTHQGGDWELERPRIGGWSLLRVMSDWQCGVDWLLAEYCRCRLRLDLHWYRWRACVKGLSLCSLRGVERQVGLARWTWWPNGIKCGPHGSKKSKTKSCMVSLLSLKTKVEPGWRGGQVMSGIGVEVAPSSRGLWRFTTKPLGLLGWATRRAETGSGCIDKLQSGRHTAWSRCLRWEDAKARWMHGRPMENFMCWPKCPCEGLCCNA
jgi:hypothetical protein